MRTIEKLLDQMGRVYVYLASQEIARQFMRDAEREGFTFGDGVKPTKRKLDSIMALNHNRTINFVGYIGHMAFQGAEKIGDAKLIRVDYSEYIRGSEHYLMKQKIFPYDVAWV